MIKSDVKCECNNTKEGIGVVQGYDYPVTLQPVQHGVVKTPKTGFILFALLGKNIFPALISILDAGLLRR